MTRHIADLRAGIRARILVPVGHVVGAPRIQLTSPLTRGGNFLYDWMWAYSNDERKHPARVLSQEAITPWLDEFPLLRKLTIKSVGAWRMLSSFEGTHKDIFGIDFSRKELDRFCRALVASSAQFRKRLDRASKDLSSESCTINVRRGDYYTYEHLRQVYGLDIEGYVVQAISDVLKSGRTVTEFVIVSDDIDWCMSKLPPLLPRPARPAHHRESIFDDLAMIAASSTLLLANSTFSFWGAHIASTSGTHPNVLAPPYHFIGDDG